MVFTLTLNTLENLRDSRYYRTPQLRLHTEKQALAFINKVGFCFLFHDQYTEIPTLLEAIAGSRREYENDHYDADIGRAWGWKDSLPVAGLVYYGKQLRYKPTLISLTLLPSFYALSPNYGELDDYLNEYQEGILSKDAKVVYEVLLERGPLATTHLRRYANLWGGGDNAKRFERAIIELQVGLKIVKSGISDVSRWGYAYIYDLFLHRFPDIPLAARQISRRQAMENILVQHLTNVVAASEASLIRLFRWETWEWENLLDGLRKRGIVSTVTIQDNSETWFILTKLQEDYLNNLQGSGKGA